MDLKMRWSSEARRQEPAVKEPRAINDAFGEMWEAALIRETWEAALIRLTEGNSLIAHFQPAFSAKDGSVYGYEALARVKELEGSYSVESLFQTLKMEVESGVLAAFDARLRELAVREAKIRGIGPDSSLFINMNHEAALHPGADIAATDRLSEQWGIPKDKIVHELTEESLDNDSAMPMGLAKKYRQGGYKIAIDNFGAGGVSLKMLSALKPDYVKIDRSLVSRMVESTDGFALVSAITTACHKLGIKVIAKGIEREQELKAALEAGIDLLSGFYLARPSHDLVTAAVSFSKGE